MRACIIRQGHEDDILSTTLSDFPAGNYSSRIGIHNNFEQDSRTLGRRTHFIILIALSEYRKVYFIINQIMKYIFKGTWKESVSRNV
nr:hypothetical protein [Dissulfuribacter thermophilus]